MSIIIYVGMRHYYKAIRLPNGWVKLKLLLSGGSSLASACQCVCMNARLLRDQKRHRSIDIFYWNKGPVVFAVKCFVKTNRGVSVLNLQHRMHYDAQCQRLSPTQADSEKPSWANKALNSSRKHLTSWKYKKYHRLLIRLKSMEWPCALLRTRQQLFGWLA